MRKFRKLILPGCNCTQEEEKRCKRGEIDKKTTKGSKSKVDDYCFYICLYCYLDIRFIGRRNYLRVYFYHFIHFVIPFSWNFVQCLCDRLVYLSSCIELASYLVTLLDHE